MTSRLGVLISAAVLLLGLNVNGKAGFGPLPRLENVPIDRLIQNLEQITRTNPKDAEARQRLARVHSMAYAQKVTVVRAAGNEVYYRDSRAIPFQVQPTNDPAKQTAAKAHLAKAVALYGDVIALKPTDHVARLGYAWCLDQSGKKQEAIAEYRRVVDAAWASERSIREIGYGWFPVMSEAAEYLIASLEPQKDRAEISRLRERMATLERIPRLVTPVIIPLRDRLGAHNVVDWKTGVLFDADGTGFKRRWTWITKDAGWLVYDPLRTRRVSSALQMFGSVSFWLFWSNGYEAMGALDDNRDGQLSGAELDGLAIWRDANSNGVSESGEVAPTTDWGITELSCVHDLDESDVSVASSPDGVRFRDGTSRPTFDVLLHRLDSGSRKTAVLSRGDSQ